MAENGQVLLIDADDTLWENNILFERAIEDFLDWVEHPTWDRARVRALLDDVERMNSATHGYGGEVFLRSLGDCLAQLRNRPVTEAERRFLTQLASAVLQCRVEALPGVEDTLRALGRRHRLLLVTKGAVEEQRRKITASRLASHFHAVHIVREKDADIYRWVVRHHGFAPEKTWMIGNSPKSDIAPAREAGLGAVFIPNDNTWVLEHAELDPADERVLTLTAFPELLRHF